MSDNIGKGLGGLLKSTKKFEEKSNKQVSVDNLIDIDLIDINPDQPREYFDENELEKLKENIIENGLLQPIVVTVKGDRFELISGERRLRATKKSGASKIFAVIKKIKHTDEKAVLAILENVQREDLNPIELGNSLVRLQSDYNLSQDEIAKRVGMTRGTVSNYLRIVKLSDIAKQLIQEKKISFGHGKVLLQVEDEEDQIELAYKCVQDQLSVRALESLIKKMYKEEVLEETDESSDEVITQAQIVQKTLQNLGLNFKLKEKKNGTGTLSFDYKNQEDLEEIINILNK